MRRGRGGDGRKGREGKGRGERGKMTVREMKRENDILFRKYKRLYMVICLRNITFLCVKI